MNMIPDNAIAVIGMACKYPDAENPLELWKNVLAKRRAFRNIPEKRLNKSYFSDDPTAVDKIYSRKAALLKNYVFDRFKYKVSGLNFEGADMAHWLALDVATEALENAGLIGLPGEIREKTGVIVGNTLTGEFSRAGTLRLRWPYAAARISAVLRRQQWSKEDIHGFLRELEPEFKKPFPAMEEDSLAGGLSNTIAGRICNYYDFKGGGFTIDGACSSSLLAVAKACDSITNKDLLVAIVGGVDLSLDPFELVGFSRAGALAKNEMLVYDRNANGFWPGEGSGFIILADYEFARKSNLNILACIKGWGISSDGKGGLTRPEVHGQYLAIKRAYERAQFNIGTVSYVEGHGTGTVAGDMAELSALVKAISEHSPPNPIYVGSIKANLGHTKAAAGIAGLIKAICILQNRLIPANTGLKEPHSIFENQNYLQVTNSDISCNSKYPLRVGVSSMGFGGINTHIAIEEFLGAKAKSKSNSANAGSSSQDTELFLIGENSVDALKLKLNLLLSKASEISYAELTDLSCTLYKQIRQQDSHRVAIEAATPDELKEKILKLIKVIENKDSFFENGIYYSNSSNALQIGFLFPGQGTETLTYPSLITKRFPILEKLIPAYIIENADKRSGISTDIAQPSIIATSIAATKLMEQVGIKANVAIGHSVGEISALYYAGSISQQDAIELARRRGKLMHESPAVKGCMISVSTSLDMTGIKEIVDGSGVSIACINSPSQMVLSGSKSSIEIVSDILRSRSIPFTLLKVENAFHSVLMNAIKNSFVEALQGFDFHSPDLAVYSTISGEQVKTNEEIFQNLSRQVTDPVLFFQAFSKAASKADIWIEMGGGKTLTNLIRSFSDAKVIPLELSGNSIKGLARTFGAMYAFKSHCHFDFFFDDRFHRTLSLSEKISFLENPCEMENDSEFSTYQNFSRDQPEDKHEEPGLLSVTNIELIFKKALAIKLNLPEEDLKNSFRMLEDFHLNSLFVGQFLSGFANAYQLRMTDVPLEYANASVTEIVQMFENLNSGSVNLGESMEKSNVAQGIEAWVCPFQIVNRESPIEIPRIVPDRKLYNPHYCGQLPERMHAALVSEPGTIHKELVVSLYGEEENEILKLLVDSVQIIKERQEINSVILVQDRMLSNGFAKSIFLEKLVKNVLVLTISEEELNAAIIENELRTLQGFREVIYAEGKRLIPEMQLIKTKGSSENILPEACDIILVTGGGKGITLECVRELGSIFKCMFILLGRSNPAEDKVLSENLNSLQISGVRFQYFQCDITDFREVDDLIHSLREILTGPITGLIHAAGINNPVSARDLSLNDILKSLNPKLKGFRKIIQCLDKTELKFCLGFGSIIAESGMAGNADYSLANQWLQEEIANTASRFPETYFLNISWSVWGGTGMGQNLGVIENLKAKGIEPISLDNGLKFLVELFRNPPVQCNVIVSGRYGNVPTLRQNIPTENKIYRFVEDVLVYYPEIELVAECDLSLHTDLYLKDHSFEGNLIFPAVFGMEAMIQGVSYLSGCKISFVEFRSVEFLRPIIIEPNLKGTIRIIVQRKDDETYSVCIRDRTTSFKQDHFKATIRLSAARSGGSLNGKKPSLDSASLLDPYDLYGTILFHKGIFQTIKSYFQIEPGKCIALASLEGRTKYFSDLLPQNLLLGHPVLNDAVMHAIQVCVPDQTLLPIRIGELRFYSQANCTEVVIDAIELSNLSGEYNYDILVSDIEGNVLQEWKSITFKAIPRKIDFELHTLLAEVVLKRKILEPGRLKNINFKLSLKNENGFSNHIKRTDGKPLASGRSLSRSHVQDSTLVLDADSNIACDMERLVGKPLVLWNTLLGDQNVDLVRMIQTQTSEEYSSVATRIWSALECIRKAGLQMTTPLLFRSSSEHNTIYLDCSGHTIISYKCHIKDEQEPFIFSILIENKNEEQVCI